MARDHDLIYPCNTIAEKYKLYCYLMVTSRILEATGYDWKKTVATCRKSDRGWVATCFQSIGRDASGNTRQNAPKILELCALAGDMARECIYGAARDITSNDASPRRARCCASRPRSSIGATASRGSARSSAASTPPGRAGGPPAARADDALLQDCARGALAL